MLLTFSTVIFGGERGVVNGTPKMRGVAEMRPQLRLTEKLTKEGGEERLRYWWALRIGYGEDKGLMEHNIPMLMRGCLGIVVGWHAKTNA